MDYPGEMKIKMDHAAFKREQAARQGCSNASCYCSGACKRDASIEEKRKALNSYWYKLQQNS